MTHEDGRGIPPDDLAGAGDEPASQAGKERQSEGSPEHGDRQGDETLVHAAQESEEDEIGRPDEAEFLEATPDERASMVVSLRWQGLLPRPEDFNAYPEEVQREIVSWAARSVEQQSRLVDSAIRLDEDESSRQNRLVAIDEKQVPRAQYGSLVLNALLLIAIAVAAYSGQVAVTTVLVTSFAGISAMNIYITVKNHRPPDTPKQKPDDAQSADQSEAAAKKSAKG